MAEINNMIAVVDHVVYSVGVNGDDDYDDDVNGDTIDVVVVDDVAVVDG